MKRHLLRSYRDEYRVNRELLIEQLGGKCIECGTVERLEFHHIFGRDWNPIKLSRWVRLARVRREAMAGGICLLCRVCNARAGDPRRDRVPF